MNFGVRHNLLSDWQFKYTVWYQCIIQLIINTFTELDMKGLACSIAQIMINWLWLVS